jgi:hypothetical protein
MISLLFDVEYFSAEYHNILLLINTRITSIFLSIFVKRNTFNTYFRFVYTRNLIL